VDIIRLLVAQGKDLSEICETICEHCLAPDTGSGAGIGCDNMTILIVAILHGRTKEEWYDWIGSRVKQNYGHETPDSLPQLYSEKRLMTFKVKREAEEARQKEIIERRKLEREKLESQNSEGTITPVESLDSGGGVTKILGSSGGISFHPGGSILSDAGTLMFDGDDSDDDDSDDDMDLDYGASSFSHTSGFKRAAKSLKEQLDELDQYVSGEGNKDSNAGPPSSDVNGTSGSVHVDIDGEVGLSPPPSPKGDLDPPQPFTAQPNGISQETLPTQFASSPGGDEPSPAVKAEGFMDYSEDPLKE
jgi:protein phosphatase PTC2/3